MSDETVKVANQDRVFEWMAAAGHHVQDDPGDMVDPDVIRLRLRMMAEEFCEYATAMAELAEASEDGDPEKYAEALVEVADAGGDMRYLSDGDGVTFGYNTDDVYAEVCDSNDSKIDWRLNAPWVVKADGKIGKDHHFREPNIKRVIHG